MLPFRQQMSSICLPVNYVIFFTELAYTDFRPHLTPHVDKIILPEKNQLCAFSKAKIELVKLLPTTLIVSPIVQVVLNNIFIFF